VENKELDLLSNVNKLLIFLISKSKFEKNHFRNGRKNCQKKFEFLRRRKEVPIERKGKFNHPNKKTTA
jgi:hypothetical protein